MADIKIFSTRDFTGGLNLRENQFQLDKSESPDMLNVDIDPRGGFRVRGGCQFIGSGDEPDTMTMFERSTAAAQLVYADGTNIRFLTSLADPVSEALCAYAGTVRFSVFKDRLYMSNGTNANVRWDGVNATSEVTLGTTFNDSLTSPTASGSTGNMPIGKVTAAHMGSLWVANTVESATAFPNRIRWSHPNFPEDWASAHYIDIDEGVDGDYITALIPHGDHLLVFKNRSVHAIYGAPPEELQVVPVNQSVGTISQESVVKTDNGIYFFSWPDGLFRYTGKQFEWLFENIYPAIAQGKILDSTSSKIMVGYGNRRVWVSVPWEGESLRSHAFVFDPFASKRGSWTFYDLSVGPFVWWNPSGEDAQFVAYAGPVDAEPSRSTLALLDQHTLIADDWGNDPLIFDSYYVTPWYDLGEYGYKKRWKRPEVAMRGGNAAVIEVAAYKDYDRRQAHRNFELVTTADALSGVWGAPSKWGTMVWATATHVRNELQRGSSLGSAKAVALRFQGPRAGLAADADYDWGIDAISFKYVPRKVRS